MSDQRRTGAVISLEEIFRSREFGRRPVRWDGAPVPAAEATDPLHLEEVFLSELFGHPEALAAAAPAGIGPTAESVERPTLVLLRGDEDAAHDFTRYRGAIGAVSGVAAAALVVAAMSSGSGPGSRSEQPTISAQGKHPGSGSATGGGSPLPAPGGAATQPNPPGAGTGQAPPATGGSSGAVAMSQFAATTPSAPAATVTVPPPAPVGVVPSPPAPGGGTSPSGTSPGGGGTVLTPVFATVGDTVSTVGSTVTAASSDLAHAAPAASPVTGLLANVGATVTSLGRSVAGA